MTIHTYRSAVAGLTTTDPELRKSKAGRTYVLLKVAVDAVQSATASVEQEPASKVIVDLLVFDELALRTHARIHQGMQIIAAGAVAPTATDPQRTVFYADRLGPDYTHRPVSGEKRAARRPAG